VSDVVVLRPRRARQVIYPVAVAVVAVLALGAVVVPSTGPMPFAPLDRVALVAFGLLIAAGLHRLAAVRVVTGPAGIEVVNIVRRTRLAWAQVVQVRLSRDDPWVMLDLSDGQSLAAMAIQQADGPYAVEQARLLARLVREHSRTERDD
jgi:Bacterial PH domain